MPTTGNRIKTVSRLSSRSLYGKTGSAGFFLLVASCGGSAPTPPALSKEQNTVSLLEERSLVSFIQQSRPLMEQKDLNSCYKKRINFELSPKVDPLTI